jgi:hypothetical protein
MVYLLDRYATIATAFEFALDEREIDRTLPCRDDLWNKNQTIQTRWFRTSERIEYDIDQPENLGSFSYYIEILGTLSRIHKFLKKPVDISALSDVEKWQGEYRELDNMLTSWKFNLPGDYGNMAKLFQPGGSKVINCGWVMLHGKQEAPGPPSRRTFKLTSNSHVPHDGHQTSLICSVSYHSVTHIHAVV